MQRPDFMDDAPHRAGSEVGSDRQHDPALARQARDETAVVAEEGRAQARHLLDETRATVMREAESQAARLADGMRAASRELASMADHSEQPDSGVAEVARQLAGEVGRVASRIDHGGLDDTLDSIRAYARRSPGRFLLGAAVLGFASGRLMRNVDVDEFGQAIRGDAEEPERTPTEGRAATRETLEEALGRPMASDLSGFATSVDARVESGGGR
jgi:hypothetical protein